MRDSASKSAIIVDGVSVGEIDDSVKQMTLTEAAGSVITSRQLQRARIAGFGETGAVDDST